MKHLRLFSAIITLTILMGTQILLAKHTVGETIHGFKLVDQKYVKEVNANCLYFIHEKNGARLFKVETDDDNKTFSVAFKTLPENDCGTPHILEHSVLNGSENFPVKSPFDVLAKGSLNTFLNAMTGSDITIYPVASKNDKDYFNLMHVYMDAVFNPLLYKDERIFMQEGWHRELTDKDAPVEYKGVVYNEMKGAFSSPNRELYFQVSKNLFPDNCYGFSSGGYPAAIPELSYESFVNFHKKYYHPSNSYFFLYGDADVEKELQFINDEYLVKYEKSDDIPVIKLQPAFDAPKDVHGFYPVAEGADTQDQTFLSMNMVIGEGADRELTMALDILTDVLVNQESAPVRLALQQAGIGKDVSASISDNKQNVVRITVKNANAEDKDKFKEIVLKTMEKAAQEGLDKKSVEGTLNRMEFRLREGDDANLGLTYNFRMLTGWFYADDPFLSLEFEKPLKTIRGALKNTFLEDVIKNNLLNNPHTLVMVMEPKPGMEKELKAATEQELADYKSAMSQEEIDALIKTTTELVEYQKREDDPEALATIPLLQLQDINPKAEDFPILLKKINDVKTLHYDGFTNDIYYTDFIFDAATVPQEMIPYASLLASVLGKMDTKNYSYSELDNELNIHTGGFYAFNETYLRDLNADNLLPQFVVSSKAMSHKLDKLVELSSEIVTQTDFTDKARLKALIERHQSRVEANVKNDGFTFALRRLQSYYSAEGGYVELTDGLTYYRFVTDLAKNFDEKSDDIIANLKRTADYLFNQNNLVVHVSCLENDYKKFAKETKTFVKALPQNDLPKQEYVFETTPKNEALMSTSKVQYVLQGFDLNKLGYGFNGNFYVLNQILSREYLQNTIRVIGGAYGGFSSFNRDGMVFFGSYRDPNLKETLDNFAATPEYLNAFEADDREMTRFIIGTISRIDRPLTPSQKGRRAVAWHFQNTKLEDIQKYRTQVLQTTPQDIRDVEEMVKKVLNQKYYCVYGGEEKIKENKELFKELISVIE